MKYLLSILALSIVVMASSQSHAQRSDSIAAVVNDDVITYTELYDRLNLVIKSAKMPNTTEFKQRLLPQVLTALITEIVQVQEAKRLGMVVSNQEINQGFAQMSAQNKLEPKKFKVILEKQNIRFSTLETQIEAQLAWGKVIQREIRPRVVLGDSDIAYEVDRLKEKEGELEYFLAEIFLPFSNEKNISEVEKVAKGLSRQLSKDVRKFPAAARQFSQSSTAAKGGIIGWITPDQINEDLSTDLASMEKGKVSDPIKTEDGYVILFLRDKRIIKLGSKEKAEKLRIKIAVYSMPNSQEDRKFQRDNAKIFARDLKGCLDIVKKITKNKSIKLQDLEDTKDNLPPSILKAVEGLDIGEAADPVEFDNNIYIPMLCGRTGSGFYSVLEREIENRMGTQRMDVLQKRYLRDLIADSYIERRV